MRALDGLRLCAALMVGAFHFIGTHDADPVWGENALTIFPALGYVAGYGWLGVEIFFVISGFVICMSSWGRSLGSFFRSRVVRLYPAYWAAVLLTYVVITAAPVLTSPDRTPSLAAAIANLTMLHEPMGATAVDSVYWTLWVEMRFYLLFALVVATGLTYRKVVGFALLWTVLTPIARASDFGLLELVVVYEYSAYFLVGIGLYLIHRYGHQFLAWAVVLVNLAAGLFRVDWRRMARIDGGAVDHLDYVVVAAVLVGAVALVLAIACGRLDWMNWRWLTYAGALTYPFYLLHQMIGYTLIHTLYVGHRVSAYAVLPATLATTLVLAWVVHRLVERPLSAVLKRQLAHPSLLDPRPRAADR